MRLGLLWSWLMEAPLLLQWLSTGSLHSLGHWGSVGVPAAMPPSLAEGLLVHPGRAAFTVPRVGRLGRHMLTSGWEAVFPIIFIHWIENLNSFQTCANRVFHLTDTWVGKKSVLERNQRCQQAYTYSGKTERNLASGFLLLPETGLPGAPREGLLLLPLFYKLSCSSAGVAINIDSPKLGMLFPVSGAPIPYTSQGSDGASKRV